MHPDFDSLPVFPNSKAMFSRSAGVEPLVNRPKLPNSPLLKIEPPGGDPMMTEYVVMHVLRLHRDMPGIERLRPTGSGAAQRLCGPNSTPKPPIVSINSNTAHAPFETFA